MKTKCKLQQAIFTFISIQTGTNYDETLMQTFRNLDKNNDGVLSKEELIEGMELSQVLNLRNPKKSGLHEC
jgi:calcium-dependent protein kinase